MSAASKQPVLVFGAAGKTGTSIVNGLLESGNFTVFATVRPGTEDRQKVVSMQSKGVAILLVEQAALSSSPPTAAFLALVKTIEENHIDTAVAMTDYTTLDLQIPLIDACKKAGVKRFIPCDTATACVKGVMDLHDNKLAIHDYIEKVGLPHTYVNVGWWFQLGIPISDGSVTLAPFDKKDDAFIYGFVLKSSSTFVVPTDNAFKKSAMTDLRDIGKFFARIVADERTVNKSVFCWSEEKTQEEVWDIVKKISGREPAKTVLPGSILTETVKPENLQNAEHLHKSEMQYFNSMWVRGDNTVANARKPEYGGALDARELYPDLKPNTLEDYVKEVFATPTGV